MEQNTKSMSSNNYYLIVANNKIDNPSTVCEFKKTTKPNFIKTD